MSVEVESNPFRPDGELSREAEDIIKNSTILRDKVSSLFMAFCKGW